PFDSLRPHLVVNIFGRRAEPNPPAHRINACGLSLAMGEVMVLLVFGPNLHRLGNFGFGQAFLAHYLLLLWAGFILPNPARETTIGCLPEKALAFTPRQGIVNHGAGPRSRPPSHPPRPRTNFEATPVSRS